MKKVYPRTCDEDIKTTRVPVFASYQSSIEVVRGLVEESLAHAAAMGAHRVALTALATGYGRMSMRDFAGAILPLAGREWPPIGEVVICVRNHADHQILMGAMDMIGLEYRSS
jgi:hypothetical protein